MSEAVKVDPQTDTGLDGLVPIDLEILQEGEPLEFPIYQRLTGSRPFALGTAAPEKAQGRPQTSKASEVYTERRTWSHTKPIVESRLGNFLSDESVPQTRTGSCTER